MLCLALAGCATGTPRPSTSPAWIQNNTSDPELTAQASAVLEQQLRANGVDPAAFDLDARLDPTPEGGLRIQILCSSKGDHLLKASVDVKGRGAPPQRLIPSLIARAARELAADCR